MGLFSDAIKNIKAKDVFSVKSQPTPVAVPAAPTLFTTTPINTDLREPRGSYSPGSRKTKDYSKESEVEMKKGGLVKKKTTMKKKK